MENIEKEGKQKELKRIYIYTYSKVVWNENNTFSGGITMSVQWINQKGIQLIPFT